MCCVVRAGAKKKLLHLTALWGGDHRAIGAAMHWAMQASCCYLFSRAFSRAGAHAWGKAPPLLAQKKRAPQRDVCCAQGLRGRASERASRCAKLRVSGSMECAAGTQELRVAREGARDAAVVCFVRWLV